MKKITINIIWIGFAFSYLVLMNSCKKYWCNKEGQYYEKYIVFKFNSGEDYSQNLAISDNFKLNINEKPETNRPIPLYNGYYLSGSITHNPMTISYLSFTYEDWDSGLVPNDWNTHWKEYVLVDSPYSEYYSVGIGDCNGIEDIPGYCSQCINTYYVDTTWLNHAIDNGTFWKYNQVKKKI